MQLVHCTVNLGGDPRRQVRRVNVSVPEVMVLRAIHGEDAVIEMEYAGERDGLDEKERLEKFYGGKQEILDKLKDLFPGARPNFPRTLGEIGVDDVATPEAIAAFEKKRAEQENVEADMERKRKAARLKREKLEALAEVAQAEESELIRPPKLAKKRDPLMA